MATNVKKANKKRAKKKTYNTNFVKYLAIGLGALVLVLVAAFLVVHFTTNYVAKVDGHKILNYEYEYFVPEALSEVREELEKTITYPDGATDQEKAQLLADAWTDEWKQKAKDLALEKAVDYETGYLLAKSKGFKLTRQEKNNVKTNVDYQLNMYYQIYSQYYRYTFEQVQQMLFGTLSIPEYKQVVIKQNVTEKYRQSLKDKYTATEEELRAIYDKDPDAYRTIDARVLYKKYPTEPKLTVTQPKRSDGTVITADLADITDAEKEQLETYEKAKEAYEKSKDEYDAKVKEIDERAEAMAKALNETGKYSEESEKAKYVEADFVTIIKGESDLDGKDEDGGLKSVSSGSKLNVTKVDDLIFTYQWDSERKGFIIVEKKDDDKEDKEETTDETAEDETAEAETEEAADEAADDTAAQTAGKNPSDISVVKTSSGVYLVRCENITDYDNSVESGEGKADSIKDKIKATLFDERATEELDKIIADEIASGKTYKASNIKTKQIDKVFKKVFGE